MNRGSTIKKLLFSIIFLLGAIFLPHFTVKVPRLEEALIVMHIPVYLCGFVCGAPWGFVVGMVSPILRSVIFGVPGLYPDAVAMMFELAFYGLLAGAFFDVFGKAFKARRVGASYLALIVAMLGGRAVWGLVRLVMMLVGSVGITWSQFVFYAFTNEWSAIILHLLIVPGIVAQMHRK